MKYEQYTALIKKLEDYAEKNPKGYERRVALLGALGYAYFIGLILIFLLIPVLAVGLLILMPKLIWIVIKFAGKLILLLAVALASILGVIWNFVRAFWTKIPAPEGYELNREEAPKLFETVEKTCDFLKAPRPDHILLIEDFNAAVMTLPRVGVFGKRVYLLIGLPLMQALSPAQFKAVLAHEIGHISEKHGSSAASAYRLRETWSRFIESQEADGHKLSFLYERFVNWYFPYFNAYSFVLCRRQEREADEYAVQLTGARPLGEALINLEVKSLHLSQKFWKDVLNEAAREKSPPKEIFTQMAMAFRETDKPQDLMNLSKAVAINTDYSDSHPSLAERLKAMGYWQNSDLPDLPGEVTETASARYFGNLEEKFSGVFNSLWQTRVKEQWQQRHDYLIEAQKRIDELNAKAETETLSIDELYEKAGLVAERYGEKESLKVLFELLKIDPANAKANFAVGTVLLNNDDESGLGFIEEAMQLDRILKIPACETLYYYLRSKGRDTEAQKYVLDIESEEEIVNLANQERSGVSPDDAFDKHDFENDKVEKICGKMRYYDEIQAMYLVRKVVRHYSEIPLYVLFIDTKKKGLFGGGQMLNSEDLLKVLVERLNEFGIHYFVILEKDFEKLKPRLEQIENAKIFQR
jgi:Zn-dependent protease with chaperone function